MNLAKLNTLIQDEGKAWDKIIRLRESFSSRTMSEIEYDTPEQAIKAAVWVVQEILEAFGRAGLDVSLIEPGHGIGHITRDYVNGLRLLYGIDAPPADIFVGAVGGVFHDIGCAMIDRYQESKHVIRHAEVGALMLLEAMAGPAMGEHLSRAEKIAVAHSVLAHTQYLRSMEVKCEDRVTRLALPYRDLDEDGNPILAMWFSRWIDRLDYNGPAFVARHLLTLAKEHMDSDGKGYYDVTFAQHMRPLLRSAEEIEAAGGAKTMLEHLNMFHQSQTNNSPYGTHDYGKMVELRDFTRERMAPIITAVTDPDALSNEGQNVIINAWAIFLTRNIEPTDLGKKHALILDGKFRNLPPESRNAWCNGFRECMKQYILWSKPMLDFLCSLQNGWNNFSPITDNVKAIIKPHPDWENPIRHI